MSMNIRPKNLDLNQLAKRIVDEATGEEPATPPPPEKKSQAAADKRRLDGLKGGVARAEKLTAEQRSEIAKLAASIRWHKVD